MVNREEDLQSKIITFLRFPLIVGVFFIHARSENILVNGIDVACPGMSPIYSSVSYLLSEIFGRIMIPMMFAISGFLFFYRAGHIDLKFFVPKWKRRVRSLLVPYILWNLFSFAITYAYFASGLGDKYGDSVVRLDNLSFPQILQTFWNYDNVIRPDCFDPEQGPIALQFWFVRDLMIVGLFSPLIYWLVKHFKHYVVILLGIIWVANIRTGITGLNVTSFFFFMLGAYCSLYKVKFENIGNKLSWGLLAVYLVLSLVELNFRFEEWERYLHNVNICFGMLSILGLSSNYLKKRPQFKVNRFLSESSFFLFAFHGIVIYNLAKFCNNHLRPTEDWQLLSLYFGYLIFTMALSLAVYKLIKTYFPKFTAIITGGR